MKKKALIIILALCMIWSLSACGGSAPASATASGAGTDTDPKQSGETGLFQSDETGLFSGEGGWKSEEGVVFLLEKDGQGTLLNEIQTDGTTDPGKSDIKIPDLFKWQITWKEDKDAVTVNSSEYEWTFKKSKENGAETLLFSDMAYKRLTDEEVKEYEEKAASIEYFSDGMVVFSENQSGDSSADLKKQEFTDVILLDDDLVTVELVAFYEKETNRGYGSGAVNEKYFTLKVKNKSDEEFLFNLSDAYVHDESVILSMFEGNYGPAPGKKKTYTYSVNYSTNPEVVPLDSLEDLYTLDMKVEILISEGSRKGEWIKTKISLSDVFNGTADESAAGAEKEDTQDAAVTETDYMTIDGLYVDNSYSTSDNENIRFLYVFYTAHTNAENLKIDSKSMSITVNGTNSYDAVRSKKQVRYMRNYYNSAYLKEVNIGDSVKFVETFEIPKAELEVGRSIRIEKSQIPDSDRIKLSTDDIVFCDNPEKIAEIADPEGYEKEVWALEDAGGDQISAVKNEINGYEWKVEANSIKYEIEFWEPDNYEIRTAISTSDGTYVVKNGYVIGTNDIGGVMEIPYTYENGKVKMDIISAFDPMR